MTHLFVSFQNIIFSFMVNKCFNLKIKKFTNFNVQTRTNLSLVSSLLDNI